MNSELALLQPYPFEKLRTLLADVTPAESTSPVSLSVGEPKHPAPQFVLDALVDHIRGVEQYPSTRGMPELREGIACWLSRRYGLTDSNRLASEAVLPVNGTREALFAIGQCLLDRTQSRRSVLMPNPFYQIYEGAALLAGCKPDFYDIDSADPQAPDSAADDCIDALSDRTLNDCQMIYLCNPGNPTGSVLSEAALQRLIERAHRHDFLIVSDECYSEIYRQDSDAPCGLLQAAHNMGNESLSRCLAFHSLSKRSNLPGLRSGFVAGDATLIEQFLLYRTYHGSSMSPAVQHASLAAWSDEGHVEANRRAYDEKYDAVLARLGTSLQLQRPSAGFYLWPLLPVDDQTFTQTLLREYNVRVVPGSYLARDQAGVNPGKNRIRLALVAPLHECEAAADRIVTALT